MAVETSGPALSVEQQEQLRTAQQNLQEKGYYQPSERQLQCVIDALTRDKPVEAITSFATLKVRSQEELQVEVIPTGELSSDKFINMLGLSAGLLLEKGMIYTEIWATNAEQGKESPIEVNNP